MLPVNPSRLPALNKEAQQHQAAGRFAQARRALEMILAIKPDLAVVHFNLAKVLLKLDEPAKALDHLDRAAELQPGEPAIWKQYATTLQWLGDATKAAAFLERAKKARIDRNLLISLQDMLRPKTGKSKTSIGSAPPSEVKRAIGYLREGRFKEAAALAESLDRAHPNVSLLADLLASAQAKLGQDAAAEQNHQRAVRLDPDYAEARANYGQFLLWQGRYDDAIAQLRDALRLLPDMPVALTNLGTALFRKSRFSQAIRFLKRALVLDPKYLMARLVLAECLLNEFKPEEAAEVLHSTLDETLPDAKNRVLYARALSDMERYEEADVQFKMATDEAVQKRLPINARAILLQTMGRFDEAHALLQDAIDLDPLGGWAYNTLLVTKKLKPGDPLIDQMKRVHSDPKTQDKDRIYLGFALSKAMEQTKAYDEVFTYLRPANDAMRALYPYDIQEHQDSTAFLVKFFKDSDFAPLSGENASSFSPIFVTGLPRSGTTLVEQIIASHSGVEGGGELSYAYEALNDLVAGLKKNDAPGFDVSHGELAALGRQIEARMRAAFPGEKRITDKGLSTHEMIGPIKAVFPKSSIIVVRRDPRDCILSMYKNQFEEGRQLYTNRLSDLAAYYHCFVDMLNFWRKKAPSAFYEIEYEALVADPETEARKLIAACGLDWEDRCMAFHENKRRVATLSVHQVRQPLYTSSTKSWQRYQDDLGELFDALGPEFDPRVSQDTS